MADSGQLKKSILKKKDALFQRSNSVSLGGNTFPVASLTGGCGDGGMDTPKKRAVILDENGVWRPGEQDDNDPSESKHHLQCSVADRTAGERVSYKLIQQRSLDFGLYSQLTKCHLDKSVTSDEQLESGDSEEQSSNRSTSPPMHCPLTEGELTGRLIASHSPSEDAVLQLIQSKEITKQFSLRDVLAHRVPELDEEEDCPTDSKGPLDEFQPQHCPHMDSTS